MMIKLDRISNRAILAGVALYYFLCAVGAIFVPGSWYFLAGVERSPVADGFLIVVGGLMLALAIGATMAYYALVRNIGVIVCLACANFFDFVLSLYMIKIGTLPLFNGVIFALVALSWLLLLSLVLYRVKKEVSVDSAKLA